MTTFRTNWVLLLLFLVALPASEGHAASKLHRGTLCPLSGSLGKTILLIDTTDPLTPVAQERLKELLKGFGARENSNYLQPAHELIVYRLMPRLVDMQSPIRICNPGHPDDTNILIESKAKAIKKWRKFELTRRRALPRFDEQVKSGQSPLLESIAWITARHVPSLGIANKRNPTRLFLFSDMLQNSQLLSHYKTLPSMKAFEKLPGYNEMRSNLNGVDVWLFYVYRTNLEHKQTPKHYYWWAKVMGTFGGRVVEQAPL